MLRLRWLLSTPLLIAFAAAAQPVPPPPPPPPPMGTAGSIGRGVIGSIPGGLNRGMIGSIAELPRGEGAIEGKVVNEITGSAVRRAAVMLHALQGGMKLTMTGAGGTFRFDEVPEGSFTITVMREGFSPSGRGAVQVVLGKGEKKSGVILKIQPGAIITGRVVDEEGEPIAGANVNALGRMPQQGKVTFAQMNSAQTDDRGEYRMYGLRPGRYRLMVMTHRRMGLAPGGESQNYGSMYYPNSREASGGQILRLAPGSETKADFRLEPALTGSVEGRVTGADLAKGISVQAMTLDGSHSGSGASVSQDGSFVIPNLAPGRYWISAMIHGASPDELAMGGQTVDVRGGGAVKGVVIEVAHGGEVRGRVRIEGAETSSGPNPDVRVMLMPSLFVQHGVFSPPPEPAEVSKADGSFVLKRVFPGSWGVSLTAMPRGGFIKSVTLGSAELLGKSIEIGAAGSAAPLEILVSAKGGVIEGTVEGGPERGPCMVVAKPIDPPAQPPMRHDIMAFLAPGSSRFHLEGLPPGTYQLLAVSTNDTERVQDPDVLEKLAGQVQTVKIEEGAKVTKDLKPITSAELDKAEEGN